MSTQNVCFRGEIRKKYFPDTQHIKKNITCMKPPCHIIAPDKALFFIQKVFLFFLFFHEMCVVGTHLRHLCKVFLMRTHNIHFHGEIRKIVCENPAYLELCHIHFSSL